MCSHGRWIYYCICNQCLSPLMLWVRISIRTRCTTLCDKVCQWLATGRWFSLCPLISSNNKTDHDITVILLKVALNTIKQASKHLGHDKGARLRTPLRSIHETIGSGIQTMQTVRKYLHMEYIYLSRSDIQELVVPIMITLIESCC